MLQLLPKSPFDGAFPRFARAVRGHLVHLAFALSMETNDDKYRHLRTWLGFSLFPSIVCVMVDSCVLGILSVCMCTYTMCFPYDLIQTCALEKAGHPNVDYLYMYFDEAVV